MVKEEEEREIPTAIPIPSEVEKETPRDQIVTKTINNFFDEGDSVVQATEVYPEAEVVTEVEASAPPMQSDESENELSKHILHELINENMFNIDDIKNTLLNLLKIEFGKLLTIELTDEQIDSLKEEVERLKKGEIYGNNNLHLSYKFTLPEKPTLKDELVVHTLSTEMNRLFNKKLWKEHIVIDLAGKILNNIDCSLSIKDRVSNINP